MSYLIVAIVSFVAGAILNNPGNRKKLADMLSNAFNGKQD